MIPTNDLIKKKGHEASIWNFIQLGPGRNKKISGESRKSFRFFLLRNSLLILRCRNELEPKLPGVFAEPGF
jgi:hypothetical protein